jgi:group I intron endonuclease
MMMGIYKITNPNNKVYIGKSINIPLRFRTYKYLNCKEQTKLYNSLKKYGPENHKFEIIEECLLEQLNEREIYYKQLELNKCNGNFKQVLFCELYDLGGGPRSEETKQKISQALHNHSRHYNEEVKKKMKKPKPEGFGDKIKQIRTGKPSKLKNQTRSYKGRVSPNKGNRYKHTEESIVKKYKPILQYDLQENFIKEWPSIKEAKNVTLIKNINLALRGSNKTAGGYIWKYKN